MLRDGTFYHDLGPNHFHQVSPERKAARLARIIEKLGFQCTFSQGVPSEVSV